MVEDTKKTGVVAGARYTISLMFAHGGLNIQLAPSAERKISAVMFEQYVNKLANDWGGVVARDRASIFDRTDLNNVNSIVDLIAQKYIEPSYQTRYEDLYIEFQDHLDQILAFIEKIMGLVWQSAVCDATYDFYSVTGNRLGTITYEKTVFGYREVFYSENEGRIYITYYDEKTGKRAERQAGRSERRHEREERKKKKKGQGIIWIPPWWEDCLAVLEEMQVAADRLVEVFSRGSELVQFLVSNDLLRDVNVTADSIIGENWTI